MSDSENALKRDYVDWTEDEIERFNERAGILEYSAGKSRADAERLAADEIERDRFRCEVRYVLALAAGKGKKASDSYLLQCEARRGTEATIGLRDTAKDQWEKGNRGQKGVWL